jgi:hypothetical protein
MRTTPFLVLFTALGLGACTSTLPAGDGMPEMKTNRVTGDVNTLVNSGLDYTFDQTVAAVRDDMQFTLEHSAKDALVGVVKARTAQNKLVVVTLSRKSDAITGVNVNAGTFDPSIARAVADRIAARTR